MPTAVHERFPCLDVSELQGCGGFEAAPSNYSQSIGVARVSGTLGSSACTSLRVAEDTHALLLVEEGTALFRCPRRRWLLAHRGIVALVQGPQHLAVKFGQGDHRATLYWWGSTLTPHVETWMRGIGEARSPALVAQPVYPEFLQIRDRVGTDPDNLLFREMQFLSALYDLAPRLLEGPNRIELAKLPAMLPDRLCELAERVAANPDRRWPMRDAAIKVGFSAFHFSRVFKQWVGYGFPEYVDRCRTERAVCLLCDTQLPLEEIVHQTGLSSPGALRDSVQEYLGLAASDLRSI